VKRINMVWLGFRRKKRSAPRENLTRREDEREEE
jgi:hypothetical protein